MSNLNCRWASAEELARIIESAPSPEWTSPFEPLPLLAMAAHAGKLNVVRAPVASETARKTKKASAVSVGEDAAESQGHSAAGGDAAETGRRAPASEPASEAAIDEPVNSWAAMISPPRLHLTGTEKVFALMGPREDDEGEARQVDLSQLASFHEQLDSPSKWRWQRQGVDIVLLGSGVTQWASLREGLLDSR